MTAPDITQQDHTVQTPSLGELTRVFARIGVLSFGGPAAQIGLMHRELVAARAWLSERSYLRALSLCMLLPGPEAMQLATYAGWRLRGTVGGVLAGALFVLPGALVIAALMAVYVTWGDVPLVQDAFLGIKAAVVAVVIGALRGLSQRALRGAQDWLLAGLSFVAVFVFAAPFPLILAAAALYGLARARAEYTQSPPPPADWAATLRTGLIWGALWLIPLAVLSLMQPGLFAHIGWFFAWLATISFGGAYALLAYMTQTVVSEFGWITTAQMIDALGLAETTPGPLILVTQFVAMLAAYGEVGLGGAMMAGAIGLWAIFLPCFLFIFAAAPHIERLEHAPRLSGALSAITAAVVGVILNLSLWFALNVFFAKTNPTFDLLPNLIVPEPNSLDIRALSLFVVAAVEVLWFNRPLPLVLLVCAVGGISLGLLGV